MLLLIWILFKLCCPAGVYGAYDPAKKSIYRKIEETAIEESLKNGMSVCIDRTNMDRKRRKRFIDIGKKFSCDIKCFDFGAGSQADLHRRLENSRGISGKTWDIVFNAMRKSYEKPTLDEGFSEIITPPSKYEFHAFDFDGTIVENEFPYIGKVIDSTVAKMNDLYQDLKNIIIIWSCRSDSFEDQMCEFMIKNKIPFDFINDNPMYDYGNRKIFVHKYYDDRNEMLLPLIGKMITI